MFCWFAGTQRGKRSCWLSPQPHGSWSCLVSPQPKCKVSSKSLALVLFKANSGVMQTNLSQTNESEPHICALAYTTQERVQSCSILLLIGEAKVIISTSPVTADNQHIEIARLKSSPYVWRRKEKMKQEGIYIINPPTGLLLLQLLRRYELVW